jgi:DNA uptake protein ComE-like DNA-binding protein
VPYVGDAALQKLQSYAAAHPAPAGETVEGVGFKGWEAEAVVWGVNHAAAADLDALVDARAVTDLLARRPFVSVAEMGPVSYVGALALGKLRGNAPAWWAGLRGTTSLAGTFDGVTFDAATAEAALAICNQATSSTELAAHGIPIAPAAAIVGNRPYTTLAQVAAVGGVGAATMSALHAYAAAPRDCGAAFDDAVGPHLPDLLFMSESDRPLDLVSFSGTGSGPITPAELLTLVNARAGTTTEVRDPANYYGDFEPASGTADPGAAAAVQAAVAAQLTDVVYIAVIPPKGGIDQAEIGAYLVGRTRCGQLVGLHAISIET